MRLWCRDFSTKGKVKIRDVNLSNFLVGFGFLQKNPLKNGLVHGLRILEILEDCGFF